jgi:penicillin-binding protein 1A
MIKSSTVKKIVWGSWITFFSFLLMLGTFVYMVSVNAFGWFGAMVDVPTLENPKHEYASELYTEDMVSFGKFFRENRTPVKYEDISPDMIHALVATEDVRFENHSGVDMRGTFAIAWYSLRGVKRGSSTISQQLAKNLFDTRSSQYEGSLAKKSEKIKMLINKTKEWMVAITLEKYYTKKEIMTMYLNTVHFGSNAYGVQVASKTFFNTTPNKLKLHEAALLVGVLKGPSIFSPILNPDTSLSRRNTVLDQMQKYKYISVSRCKAAQALSLSLDYEVESHNRGLATYFRSQITPYLLKWCNEKGLDLYADGLKIYTTIDSRLQKHAEEAVSEHMKTLQKKFSDYWGERTPWRDQNMKEIPNFIENAAKKSARYKQLKELHGNNEKAILRQMNRKIPMRVFSWNGEVEMNMSPMDSIRYYKKFLQAGFMAMDPLNGHIKAWVGGINHKHFKYDHVKQGKRQPGSTFKPFIYAAALDIGNYSPCFEVADLPVTFELEGGKTWTPQNSGDVYSGKYYTLRQAMANSINSIAAHLVKQFGPETILQYARRMGVESPMQPTPSIYLGVYDASVYEMVGAYSTFVNQGLWTEPFYILRIEDRDGNILQNFIPRKVEALDAETAYLMVHMLRGATEEEGGTALGLSKWGLLGAGGEIGGKTGTTQNHADGWFMGITPHIVAGAWVGGDDRSIHFRTIEDGQGARMAMPIWGLFMSKVFADPKTGIKQEKFPRPERPLSIELDCEVYKNTHQRVLQETKENW